MAYRKQGAEAQTEQGGGFDWKSILVKAPVPPRKIALTPAQGSPVVSREIAANSDVYLSISVLSFYHPEARKGLTRQVPLIFADATWRRPTDTDLPQVAVMGPNPEAHPNLKSHGNYAFGGRTFFGPERFDGSVDINIGLHLFKSNAAARKLVDVARAGSKLLPKGEMLILGGIAGAGIDGALKGIKELLPDEQTPWIVGVILSLAATGNETFTTGTWAAIAGGGADPGEVYFDARENLLRDVKGKPLQRAYIVYSIDATDTNPDRLRIGTIPKARERLRQAHMSGTDVSDARLRELFRQFCGEVELSDELTQRDRDEIIADAKERFTRLMKQREGFNFADDAELFPAKDVSPAAVSGSALRAIMDGAQVAAETEAAIDASLEGLAHPDGLADEGLSELVSQLYTAVDDYAALVRSNPERYRTQLRGVAKKLRDRREFKALMSLATAVRDGGVQIGWLHYFGASADVEMNGAPSLADLARAEQGDPLPPMVAEAFLTRAIQLAGKDFENDPGLLSDCLGLQGRIWKQRAVRAKEVNEATRLAFERSYAFYMQGMAATTQSAQPDPEFHQVNLLGLMRAAQARGITLGKKADAAKWARAILKAAKKGGSGSDWELANAGDAALYLGREAEAIAHYTAYLEKAKEKPFALNATRRQLVEMWGIDPKANTALSHIVRQMAQLAMRSMATVSLSIDEIEAMAETAGPEADELEALLDGVKAMPAADIRKVLKLSQAVGKVCAPNGRAVGTGFLLHGRHVHPALANEYVFLTNDHVVCDEKSYAGASIPSAEACIFFEDLNPDEIYRVSEIFWRSDSKTHDCAILRLHKQPEGLLGELEIQDSLPLRHSTQTGQADKDAPLRAPRVFVVGHPNGRGLEITFEHNYIIDHELKNPAAKATPQPVRIHYRAPTEPGNSGSPVLSTSSLKLIGIHHSTPDEPLGRMRKPNESYKANEGLWIQAIIAAVRAEKADVPAAKPVVAAPVTPPVAPAPEPASEPAPAAPAVSPAPAPLQPGTASAARIEVVQEDDAAFFENMDGRRDTAETGYESMDVHTLESGSVAPFSGLNPKPKAQWPALADHPDTKHLAHLPIDLNNGMSFQFSGAVLRQALAFASTPVGANWSRRVLFGIRGAAPKTLPPEGAPAEFSGQLPIAETEPNHVGYNCVMGVWDRETDLIWLCPGSTVPAVGYLWNSVQARADKKIGDGANMLPPGVYQHVVGTHANGGKTRQPGAFRQKSRLCVMRLASPELSFRSSNVRWDTATDSGREIGIWDNIHAGLGARVNWGADHYSAGCQVVKGSVMTPESRDTPTGYWASFRMAAGLAPKPEVSSVDGKKHVVKTPEDGTAFTYVLMTAREMRLASEHLGAAGGDTRFLKLRRGSQGETVKMLQAALGVTADGDFGYQTQRALIAKQLELTGEADGVVPAANAAAFGLA
ncbi:trypsin-like peptidase domain-containing protein [Hyphomonas sp.]|jgi:hypothetical protein|uniref:trypsin-like peptidase domain-containing protein n=1 Tax=Hyphomonas sp. TaxID=87 RepID=UPI0037BF0631